MTTTHWQRLIDLLRPPTDEDRQLFWADELVDLVLATRIQQDRCMRLTDKELREHCELVLELKKKKTALLRAKMMLRDDQEFPDELRVRGILPHTSSKRWLRLNVDLGAELK